MFTKALRLLGLAAALMLVGSGNRLSAQTNHAPWTPPTPASMVPVAFVTAGARWGSDAVWNGGSFTAKECAPGEGHAECLAAAMRANGATLQALSFAKTIGFRGYLKVFRDFRGVDLGLVWYPFQANDNEAPVLLNGIPAVLDVWKLGNRVDLSRNRKLAVLPAAGPPLSVSDVPPQFVAERRLPGGGQRFLFRIEVSACHACKPAARPELAYDFDQRGQFLGVKIVAANLLPATENAERLPTTENAEREAACFKAPNKACLLVEALKAARVLVGALSPNSGGFIRVPDGKPVDVTAPVQALISVADSQAAAGLKTESAVTFLEARGAIASSPYDVRTTEKTLLVDGLGRAAEGLAEADSATEALGIRTQATDQRERTSILKGAVIGLARAGKAADALRLARKINDRSDRARSLLRVATVLAERGLRKAAAAALEEALELMPPARDEQHRVSILADAAAVQAKIGLSSDAALGVNRAMSVVHAPTKPWHSGALFHLLGKIALTEFELGQTKAARRTLAAALGVAKHAQASKKFVLILQLLANPDLDVQLGADELLNISREFSWDDNSRSMMLLPASEALAEAGDTAAIALILPETKNPVPHVMVEAALARAFVLRKQPNQAMRIIKSVLTVATSTRNPDERCFELVAIANALPVANNGRAMRISAGLSQARAGAAGLSQARAGAKVPPVGKVIVAEVTPLAQGTQEAAHREVIYIGKDGLRIELPGSVWIFRADRKVIYVVRPVKRQVVLLTPQLLTGLLAWQLKSMPLGLRADAEKMLNGAEPMPFAFHKGDGKGTFGKWHCQLVDEVAYGKLEARLCVVPTSELGLSKDDLRIVRSFDRFMAPVSLFSPFGFLPEPVPVLFNLERMARTVGYEALPVHTKQLLQKWQNSVIGVENKPLADRLFWVPLGYREVPMRLP